jgi:LuxR family maltose regulon positive regulatory protein
MELIRNKLMPPLHIPRVSRTRLLDLIERSRSAASATILTGRSGVGKTILAADYVRKSAAAVAWFDVDATDILFPVFLRYFMASIKCSRPEFDEEALIARAQAATEVEIPAIAEELVERLQTDCEPLLIVLDNLNLIYDAAWVAPFLQRLLPLLPCESHLLILSRTLPPAPLWRLRSKQRLIVCDEATLAFTKEEAEELFLSYGLSTELAEKTWRTTHGRAAAMDTSARGATTDKGRGTAIEPNLHNCKQLLY